MATALHNPTFKRPSAVPPPRLPSPPRAFVEPLSPAKPVPLEPSFNYPAINSHLNFAARPESAYVTTPRARAYSASHKSSHQRTPSTIDTLAEAALAASPSYPPHPTTNAAGHEKIGYTHPHPPQYVHGASEPPHKRARSELLPSPFVEQYASRPATSYEPGNGWLSGPTAPGHAYNSRVEEAALLLNFQSGGWPTNAAPNFAVPPAATSRPHANSFPQDAFHVRPTEMAMQSQSTLLPPFNPHETEQSLPAIPPSQTTINDNRLSLEFSPIDDVNEDVEMKEEPIDGDAEIPQQVTQTQTPPDDPSAPSLDAAPNAPSEAPPKGRRGWPKGKPRGSGARKSMTEKSATKRAASRKKPVDVKASRTKAGNAAGVSASVSDWTGVPATRRKSVSDALVFGERVSPVSVDTPRPPRAQSVPVETPMMVREASPSKAGSRRKVAVRAETICAACETCREATTSHGELDEWISCNGCKKWFHIDCAGFKKAHEVRDVDKFFCTACEAEHGKTTYVRKSTRAHASVDYAELQRGVLKTSEESVEHHYIQPIKDGTFVFEDETFPRMRPEMVTREFFERSGTFVEPICIPAEWNPRPWVRNVSMSTTPAETQFGSSEDEMVDLQPEEFEYNAVTDLGQDELDMVMPQGLTVRQVCNLVGPDWPIDVIDVKTQNSGAKWTLSRWADYYEELGDEKAIRNVISLEVSQTKLGRLLQRPKVVRDIDLQDDVWPQEEIDKGKFPKVQFYCLMSVADSYTDFHIDFGGSSVYYHILKGKKTFFFIPPKPKHLKAYEEWNDSPQQNYTFLPSITKECYRVDLSEGDTMLIPSGWIHAVWTPEDSLVIGGNFLNRMSYKNQFRVVEIEKVNETPIKFRYPFFQKIMWYTAIKYLKDDPLPEAVSQLFYEGEKFERDVPIWADFNGEIADKDTRPGARNARFYSQAEVEGLPDLVNFIFRTVMLVMGRIEGISTDRMKRVGASIPKGYGEPLDLAKTFALWVAWKRGNEDPPAWAHPDAVLPSSKEEGPPKKLSERKLRELERKEAIAAWRIAPDRQSVRVMTKNAKDAATSVAVDDGEVNSSPAPTQAQNHQLPIAQHHDQSYAAAPPPPAAFMMPTLPGQHLSTPKTSVLGPKRVACDACRKRRIRCKHKDIVMQATPNHLGHFDGGSVPSTPQVAPELHDNITVTPTKSRESITFMSTVMDGQLGAVYSHGTVEGDGPTNGIHQINGPSQQPGTTAYVNANIPMAMNGVPMFPDIPKRGRNKACYECRKSKRRCIHDENGNIDLVKASEIPVPRASISSKKRPFAEDGSPLLVSKKHKESLDLPESPSQAPQLPLMQGHGVLKPQSLTYKPSKRSRSSSQPQGLPHQQTYQDEQPPIDPNLFSMYPEPQSNATYGESQYPYPTTEQTQQYDTTSQPYEIPSLEQIANEVLVDLNGNEYSEQGAPPDSSGEDIPHLPSGPSKTEESVDSAISLPNTESSEQNTADTTPSNDHALTDIKENIDLRPASASADAGMPAAHPTVETNGEPPPAEAELPLASPDKSSGHPKGGAGGLPLYQPPAALSRSPEAIKRQPALANGVGQGKSPSPTGEPTSAKRKRDSKSATPGTIKKLKTDRPETQGNDDVQPALTKEERQSIELAKMLQQEELGLRRRSK